jgi:hypothetical protein
VQRISNVIIHYSGRLDLTRVAEEGLRKTRLGPITVFHSITSWPLAVKRILEVYRDSDWVGVWNNDVHSFSPNFVEFADILKPDVGLASTAFYGSGYIQHKPGANPRIVNAHFVEGTALFVNTKTFEPDWLDTRFPWGMDQLLGQRVRDAGLRVVVDRGVHFTHVGGASHTQKQIREAKEGYKEFLRIYGKILKPSPDSCQR